MDLRIQGGKLCPTIEQRVSSLVVSRQVNNILYLLQRYARFGPFIGLYRVFTLVTSACNNLSKEISKDAGIVLHKAVNLLVTLDRGVTGVEFSAAHVRTTNAVIRGVSAGRDFDPVRL